MSELAKQLYTVGNRIREFMDDALCAAAERAEDVPSCFQQNSDFRRDVMTLVQIAMNFDKAAAKALGTEAPQATAEPDLGKLQEAMQRDEAEWSMQRHSTALTKATPLHAQFVEAMVLSYPHISDVGVVPLKMLITAFLNGQITSLRQQPNGWKLVEALERTASHFASDEFVPGPEWQWWKLPKRQVSNELPTLDGMRSFVSGGA